MVKKAKVTDLEQLEIDNAIEGEQAIIEEHNLAQAEALTKPEQAPPCAMCLWLDRYIKGGVKEMTRHMENYHTR